MVELSLRPINRPNYCVYYGTQTLDQFGAHKRQCNYAMIQCPHCKKEYSKRDKKQHQEGCLDFFKFKNNELQNKVTRLEKDVDTLTRQNQAFRENEVNFNTQVDGLTRQNAEIRKNAENLKKQLKLTKKLLKEKTEELKKQNSTVNVPSVAMVPTTVRPTTALIAPRIGHINMFKDLKTRIQNKQELIQDTDKNGHFGPLFDRHIN